LRNEAQREAAMNDLRSDPTERTPARKLWWRMRQATRTLPRSVLSIGAMGAALSMVALIFLGYDLAKGKLSPCEAIFQESALGLSTRISFLQTEGELQIGRDKLTDLDERAQMAALNLKTCCTVLDAGRVDPEQFLQCKGKARAYEARLEDIGDLVRAAVKEGMTTSSIAANASPPPAQVQQEIAAEVEAAKAISRDFNREVVDVRKAQALESLEATPPRHVKIEAQESEPNDDGMATNEIKLGAWVTGSVGAPKDADFYAFTTPETHRDWIRIELQNRSTTLEPRLERFDAEKSSLDSLHKTTQGADLVYTFVGAPATPYVVRVSNYYGQTVGVYLLRVVATKAYDAQEPNDAILTAKAISVGETVTAGIMDKNDVDYFTVTSGDDGRMRATVQNRSTTLQPEVVVYDATKAQIGAAHNTTPGGDVSFNFKATKAAYYIRVRDYYTSAAGDYTLTVAEAPPADG
jgi:hypothetical protein